MYISIRADGAGKGHHRIGPHHQQGLHRISIVVEYGPIQIHGLPLATPRHEQRRLAKPHRVGPLGVGCLVGQGIHRHGHGRGKPAGVHQGVQAGHRPNGLDAGGQEFEPQSGLIASGQVFENQPGGPVERFLGNAGLIQQGFIGNTGDMVLEPVPADLLLPIGCQVVVFNGFFNKRQGQQAVRASG